MSTPHHQPDPPPSFLAKKAHILQNLSVPVSEYDDLSPKGSIDVGIRGLIDEINASEGWVTTSSCAGRVSVFLEGTRRGFESEGGPEANGEVVRDGLQTAAGVGGKGGGGRWLFVSHDPVLMGPWEQSESESESESGIGGGQGGENGSHAGGSSWTELMGMRRIEGGDKAVRQEMESGGVGGEMRLVHFKFEPMILHVLTASPQEAQTILSAALQAGFRESGALNLISSTAEPATPMVGIRSMGLALESVVGFESHGREICIVPEWQLRHLVQVSNQRFAENAKRFERFRTLLREMGRSGLPRDRRGDGGEWEDAGARRERKRAEGLRRAEELKLGKEVNDSNDIGQDAAKVLDVSALDQNP